MDSAKLLRFAAAVATVQHRHTIAKGSIAAQLAADAEDPTERAVMAVCGVCDDFRQAQTNAVNISRLRQLRERARMCVELLADVEEALIVAVEEQEPSV